MCDIIIRLFGTLQLNKTTKPKGKGEKMDDLFDVFIVFSIFIIGIIVGCYIANDDTIEIEDQLPLNDGQYMEVINSSPCILKGGEKYWLTVYKNKEDGEPEMLLTGKEYPVGNYKVKELVPIVPVNEQNTETLSASPQQDQKSMMQKIIIVASYNWNNNFSQLATEVTEKINKLKDDLNNSVDRIEEESWVIVKTETVTCRADQSTCVMTCTAILELRPTGN